GLLALRSLTEVDRAPLGATADGVDGGEIKGLAGNTRAHRRQAGRRDTPAALGDHRVEPGVRDERARIGEARQYAELPEQRRGRVGTDPGDSLQQVGIGRSRAWLTRGTQGGGRAILLVDRGRGTYELLLTSV